MMTKETMTEARKRTIVFMLPGPAPKTPVGGYKMVYCYANEMVKRGWEVEIVFSVWQGWKHNNLRGRLSAAYRYPYYCLTQEYRKCYWFALDSRIKLRMAWSFSTHKYNDDALYVATAIQTAYALHQSPVPKEQQYYFIQDFENWFFSDAEVERSYGFGMRMVTISQWLRQRIEAAGGCAKVIPNGFDPAAFCMNVVPEERKASRILMLYHRDARKGVPYGLEALNSLRKKRPDLQVTLFGVVPHPTDLPQWMDYEQTPSKERLCQLYNEAAIFLGTSVVEGWGLTVGEAMMCGCAVACTDIDGYKEMVTDGKTALLCAPRDGEAMEKNLQHLISDDNLRLRLAHTGHQHIQEFTLQRSLDKWIDLFSEK